MGGVLIGSHQDTKDELIAAIDRHDVGHIKEIFWRAKEEEKRDLANARDRDGYPILQKMVLRRDTELFDFLGENGADPNQSNRYGQAAVHLVAIYGYKEFAERLVKMGARFERDKNGYWPSSLASNWYKKTEDPVYEEIRVLFKQQEKEQERAHAAPPQLQHQKLLRGQRAAAPNAAPSKNVRGKIKAI